MGQGSDTGMAQIVGEVLNVPAELVRIVQRDTDVTPYDMGTLGSRSTVPHGPCGAPRGGGRARQDQQLARDVGEPEGSNIPVAELFKKRYGMQAGNIIGTGHLQAGLCAARSRHRTLPNVTPFWMVSGAGAEVEVDTETGHVKDHQARSTSSTAARRSIRRSSRRRFPAQR